MNEWDKDNQHVLQKNRNFRFQFSRVVLIMCMRMYEYVHRTDRRLRAFIWLCSGHRSIEYLMAKWGLQCTQLLDAADFLPASKLAALKNSVELVEMRSRNWHPNCFAVRKCTNGCLQSPWCQVGSIVQSNTRICLDLWNALHMAKYYYCASKGLVSGVSNTSSSCVVGFCNWSACHSWDDQGVGVHFRTWITGSLQHAMGNIWAFTESVDGRAPEIRTVWESAAYWAFVSYWQLNDQSKI